MTGVLLPGAAIWLLILAFAMLNGAVREQGYARMFGEHRAHQLSTLALCLVILVITLAFLSLRRGDPYTQPQLLLLGVWWTLLTLGFEFLFFGLLLKRPRSVLLRDWNLAQGRLFPLVLITTLLAPLLMGALL